MSIEEKSEKLGLIYFTERQFRREAVVVSDTPEQAEEMIQSLLPLHIGWHYKNIDGDNRLTRDEAAILLGVTVEELQTWELEIEESEIDESGD